MEPTGVKRKLAVILAADVEGYSRLMGADEEATLKTLNAYRQVIDGLIARHEGRIVGTAGDSVLAEFASPVEAVRCAIAIQEELRVRNAELPDDRQMRFRIGVNLGDVMVEGDDLYGDGVNVAARLEGLAEPGGICISGDVYNQVKRKLSVGFEDIGPQEVKNIAEPVPTFRIVPGPVSVAAGVRAAPRARAASRWRIPAIAAAVVGIVVIGGVAIWNFYLRGPAPLTEVASEANMAFPLPEKPSIAVLPFDNLTGDPGQEYLSDGFTESIITSLSKIPKVFVIARNSSFTYKGKPVKVSQVAEELGVRYVLEGSLQRSGDTLRISAQLVDAVKGHHLWAERYDRNFKDIFAVQDEIAEKIVTALEVKLTEGEQERVARRYTDDAEAQDLFWRGMESHRRYTKEAVLQARQLFERAIGRDPNFAAAYARLSATYFLEWSLQWSEDPEALDRALKMAQRAVDLDDSLPLGHRMLGWILLWKKQFERAVAEARRAIELDPNFAEGYSRLATILHFADPSEEAIGFAQKAMRLDPHYPSNYLLHLGQAYYSMGQYEKAIAELKRAVTRNPNNAPAHRWLAAIFGQLGRNDEAQAEVAEIVRLSPGASVQRWRHRVPYKDRAILEQFIDGLRKAGLPERPPLKLPDKPSIAVLPFTNMSADPEQEYFSDGITEDLITDLAKISGLFVVSRNAVFRYKDKPVKPDQVSQDLGVRYVLEGSVRKAGDRVRINTQLIDATTGGHLWAERYDRQLKDIFSLQDEITQKIVTALEVRLTKGEQEQVARRYTDNLEAYDLFLRSRTYRLRFTKQAVAQARQMLERAIELDPKFAAAYADLSLIHFLEAVEWSEGPEVLDQGLKLAQRAVALDDSLPLAHTRLGWIYLWKKQHEQAITEFERAVALDANYALAYTRLGATLAFAGRPDEAIPLVKKAMRLNPHGDAIYPLHLGIAYYLSGQYEEAIAALKEALARSPDYLPAHRKLAAVYVELGRMDEARAEVAEHMRVSPGFSLGRFKERIPIKDPAVLERYINALRKAGLPEKSRPTAP